MRKAPTPATDAELVRRALAGDAEAYHDIVRRFERPLLSLIVRMVRDPVLAEDLAQETFVKAFRHLKRYDARRKLSSWLFKIAHNTTLDHLRKKSLETLPLEPTGEEGEEGWDVLPAPETVSPERVFASGEILAGLERAIARLKPHYREILLLRFREGLAYHEIADVVGLPMGTVKIQLHRARKQLVRELEVLGLAPREPGADGGETQAADPGGGAVRREEKTAAKQASKKLRKASTRENGDGRKHS